MDQIQSLRYLLLLSLLFVQDVTNFSCDFADETIPVKQPDGRTVCVCDRSRGYIGGAEYACSYIACPVDMIPDDYAICHCKEEFYLKHSQCTAKTVCNLDDIIVHNGSAFDDRKCLQKDTQVSIRAPPLVMIEDIQPTSFLIKTFRSQNETGQYNVTLTVDTLTGEYHRVVTEHLGEAIMSVSIHVTTLEANTSYRLSVTTSNAVSTSYPAIILLQTQEPVPARAAPAVTIMDINQTTCTLEVTPDSAMDSGNISLRFRNLTDDKEGFLKIEIDKGKETTVLSVKGLVANTTYQFTVRTGDIAGLSDARQVMVHTKADNDMVKQPPANTDNIFIKVIPPIVSVFIVLLIAAYLIKRRFSDKPREEINVVEEGKSEVDAEEALTENCSKGDNADETAEKETLIKSANDGAKTDGRGLAICHPEDT